MIKTHVEIKAHLKDYLSSMVSQFTLIGVSMKFTPTVAMITTAYGQFTQFLNETIEFLLEKRLCQ